MGLPLFSESAAGLSRVAPMLLETAVRSAVILGIAGVVTAGMRRSSAAARYWVWMLAIAGLLVLPVMTAVMPPVYMRRASVPAPGVVSTPSAAPTQVTLRPAEPPTRAGIGEHKTALEGNGGAMPASAVKETATPAMAASQETASAEVTPILTLVSIASPAAAAALKAKIQWALWLVLAWLVGLALVLGHLLLGFMSLWVLERRSVRMRDGAWKDLVGELAETLGVRGRVQLLVTSRRAMPMTWGLVSSRLLLPEQAGEWSPEQRARGPVA